jgi:hypothetical protein
MYIYIYIYIYIHIYIYIGGMDQLAVINNACDGSPQGERVFAIWNPPLKHAPSTSTPKKDAVCDNDDDNKANYEKVLSDKGESAVLPVPAPVNKADSSTSSTFAVSNSTSVSTTSTNSSSSSSGSGIVIAVSNSTSVSTTSGNSSNGSSSSNNGSGSSRGTRPHEKPVLGSSNSTSSIIDSSNCSNGISSSGSGSSIGTHPHELASISLATTGSQIGSSSSGSSLSSSSTSDDISQINNTDDTTGSWNIRNHTTDTSEVTQSKLPIKKPKKNKVGIIPQDTGLTQFIDGCEDRPDNVSYNRGFRRNKDGVKKEKLKKVIISIVQTSQDEANEGISRILYLIFIPILRTGLIVFNINSNCNFF